MKVLPSALPYTRALACIRGYSSCSGSVLAQPYRRCRATHQQQTGPRRRVVHLTSILSLLYGCLWTVTSTNIYKLIRLSIHSASYLMIVAFHIRQIVRTKYPKSKTPLCCKGDDALLFDEYRTVPLRCHHQSIMINLINLSQLTNQLT